MQKRYLYAVMFAIPGFFLAVLVALWLFGVLAGGLWLFASGDDAWSKPASLLPVLMFGVVLLVVWVKIVMSGFRFGKRQETQEGLNRTHLKVAVGLTVLPLLLISLMQCGIKTYGPQSDGQLCSDYCLERGYAGSGMPSRISGDRTCSCYDRDGQEVIKVPVIDLQSASR